MSDGEKVYKVDMLTRVEGEGRFYLKVRDGQVIESRLNIFEAPRYFEAFLRGRAIEEVPDIVARICGICPVAYQMSAVRALENALGRVPASPIRALRRLLYCGEWIESHALHIFLLHAPDFLGYASAMAMAADHKAVVERGLRIKKAGNGLIALLGGRAIHPVSVRLGGFTSAPEARLLADLRPTLQEALNDALATVHWAAGFSFPAFEQDYTFVCLDGTDYPLEWGDHIYISGQGRVAVADFHSRITESQVAHSTALQSRLKNGQHYLCGPMARLNRHHQRLHPQALDALHKSSLTLPVRNPYQSIVVRSLELVHALAEALDIIDAYQRPVPAFEAYTARAAIAAGATEAPRGLLYHRYQIGDDGLVKEATIIPPTSQNQAQIEADLVAVTPQLLALEDKQEHEQATHLCEQLIRSYDPCISCATHFLRLDIDRDDTAQEVDQ
ncbi:Ni/Fe hydrogenase subunit alpha [Exilibacterium tricleocarpae]|uniref:Ni/Fe hydrogenase subunit alpha n=1 Tax=Exilibacterium tricleocarpae TaxID=2591008 RepID=A0A545U9J9_9GAMM|nr:nickel-dependent hydrogenase large subunit [Exilibacterium tricleocarpae]TQV86141.1 Ni/Fe hydrogenase subunit alpha [Exilibacterium tricleocarpae]